MKKGLSSYQIAAAYISTVVGAGFATGQEVLQFFTRFGVMGYFGIAVACVLFVAFGIRIMRLGNRFKAKSHLEVIRACAGRLAPVIDGIITFFLLGALSTMFAGSGSLFELFGLNGFLGCLLMALITSATVLFGFKGVVNCLSIVMPFLLLGVFTVGLLSLAAPSEAPAVKTGVSPVSWLPMAVLYVSYNILLSIAVLCPLGAGSYSGKTMKLGAIFGGVGLGLGALMIHISILYGPVAAVGCDVPMIYLAGRISAYLQLGYTVVIAAEIYSTAASSLYGFAARLADQQNKGAWRVTVLLSSAASLLLSQVGFVNLVRYLYPVVGICGLILLICLLRVRKSNAVG